MASRSKRYQCYLCGAKHHTGIFYPTKKFYCCNCLVKALVIQQHGLVDINKALAKLSEEKA